VTSTPLQFSDSAGFNDFAGKPMAVPTEGILRIENSAFHFANITLKIQVQPNGRIGYTPIAESFRGSQ
jgi:hypothetical protein